jgi:hypothetical protein
MRRTRTSSSRRGPSLKTDSRTSLFVSRRTARPSTRVRTWPRVSRRTGALLRWSSSGKWLSLPVCLPGPHSFPRSVARFGHIDRIVGRSPRRSLPRSIRPRRRTVALRASVGSTESTSTQSASVSSHRRSQGFIATSFVAIAVRTRLIPGPTANEIDQLGIEY